MPGWRMDGGWTIIAVDRYGVIRRERIVYDLDEEEWACCGLERVLDELDAEPSRATSRPRLTVVK